MGNQVYFPPIVDSFHGGLHSSYSPRPSPVLSQNIVDYLHYFNLIGASEHTRSKFSFS